MSKSIEFDAWNAGFVRRWHTNVRMNRHTDLNCSHQNRVAILLLKFFPDCTKEELQDALTHDQGEIAFADVPYPVKRDNPELRIHGNHLEETEIERQGLYEHIVTGAKQRRAWCDLFDSYLWMLRCEPGLRKRPEWKSQIDQIVREAQEWGIADEVMDMIEAAKEFYVE